MAPPGRRPAQPQLRAALRPATATPATPSAWTPNSPSSCCAACWSTDSTRFPAVVDLVAVAEIAAAYRGRVLLAADPETSDAVDQAVADLLARQGAE